MSDDIKYTWINFYMEFANKLLAFKDDRQTLIVKLQRAYEHIGMRLPKLETNGMLVDIDPFTVFGLFNKKMKWENRRNIAEGLGFEFEVEAQPPEDFMGIPVLNPLSAVFYAFLDGRSRDSRDEDINRLWEVFSAALSYADDPGEEKENAFLIAFDAVVHQYQVKWKLTMGLYWVRPYAFINLDSRNREFLSSTDTVPQDINDKVKAFKGVPSATEYLGLCNRIFEVMKRDGSEYKTFPELSLYAWGFTSSQPEPPVESEPPVEPPTALGDDGDIRGMHYWLYAPGRDAHMWEEFYKCGVMGLGWFELGDLSTYATKEAMRLKLQEVRGNETSQKNSALATWQFVHDLKPGDVVFVKRGRSDILGRRVVTGNYYYDSDGGGYPNLREVKWEFKGSWHLDEQFAMKTLTDVTDYPDFIAKIEALFEREDDEDDPLTTYPGYSKEAFLDEVYMDEASYDTLVGVLHSKKNIILQGPPGVGKTFAAKRLAYSMMDEKDTSRVMMVQFHQSYSYEDFIEGYRPSRTGFGLTKGSFYTFCKKAADDEDNDYFFIIDEINRGNLSKIFGELFMLIENDKRGDKNKLPLLYSHELFYVPSNLYLIGMMNTADRSLALLDYALRRRFAFFELKPGFSTEGFRAYQKSLASPGFDALVQVVERLNEDIADDESLGEGFCIGHSYFCGMDSEEVTDARLSAIVEYELLPMLREYWFDEPDKVRMWADRLHGVLA